MPKRNSQISKTYPLKRNSHMNDAKANVGRSSKVVDDERIDGECRHSHDLPVAIEDDYELEYKLIIIGARISERLF